MFAVTDIGEKGFTKANTWKQDHRAGAKLYTSHKTRQPKSCHHARRHPHAATGRKLQVFLVRKTRLFSEERLLAGKNSAER